MTELETVASRSPVLGTLSALEIQAVSAFFTPRTYERGTSIFQEGEEGLELFLILSGKVDTFMNLADGSVRPLGNFGPGEIFGEMSIIEGEPRSGTCLAEETTRVLVMSGLDFYRLTWDYPVLGSKILTALNRIMIQRLSQASSFLDDMVRWGATARKRAVTDSVTGLFNRRFLEESMRLRFVSNPNRLTSLLMMDLDHFREINGDFGPEAGDAVIANVATTIQRVVRSVDIPARLSGDEFAVLLPETGIDAAFSLAERIRSEVSELFLEFRAGPGTFPKRVQISVSIGVVSCPNDATDHEELFRVADKALYQAKEAGRNCVRVLKP